MDDLALRTRVALLEQELAEKERKAAELEAQVSELLPYKDEATSAPSRAAELRKAIEDAEDALVKAKRSASDAAAELRRLEAAGSGQEQLVADAETFAAWYSTGKVTEDTRPAARRLAGLPA